MDKPCTEAAKAEKEQNARHLKGFGAVDRDTEGITDWLREIELAK